MPVDLPPTLQELFYTSYDGRLQTQCHTATAARAVEEALEDCGITYKTTIVRSKRRGLIYVTQIFDVDPPSDVVEPL